MPPTKPEICCALRECFVIGIVHMVREPTFDEVCDQVDCFENQRIKITFCPFCGKPTANQPMRDAQGNLLQ